MWTGTTAAELGLVDQLGGLDAAVQAAAARAGVERFELSWPAAQLSPARRLLHSLFETAGIDAAPTVQASPLARLLGKLEGAAADLLRWNDRDHLYAHCLCEAP